jgi:uncharacterized protein
MSPKNIHMVTFLLMVAGGINWLLIGVAEVNVVQSVFGSLARLVYVAVGAATAYEIYSHKKDCKLCE